MLLVYAKKNRVSSEIHNNTIRFLIIHNKN